MPLLTLKTDDRSSVRVFADAILFDRQTSHSSTYYHSPGEAAVDVYAMSIIGPEQAVRHIQAGSAREEQRHQRIKMTFTGASGTKIVGRWAGPWHCSATLITTGAMHMVAMPKVTVAKQVAGEIKKHVVIPDDTTTDEAIRRAIYQRLLLSYPTPLIPFNMRGQSAAESAAGEVWCDVITGRIMRNKRWWRELKTHPDQPDKRWSGSGLLTITDDELDKLVGGLIVAGEIVIPGADEPLQQAVAS